ncbi:phage holin family protein [Peptoniphilus sp. BV3C26]|uniref:phage holin family protein n=1 Tax=Peptoniphilus sp. BV3C26 TaxID=1111134 RepID=UPI0003B8C9B8|nr:phage holin family protein [Peptoniphilus sp. BV3C26]ERT62267.1 hypothetical protein HMPREF1253_1160 [Peptoniphilus sp. BV3C26]
MQDIIFSLKEYLSPELVFMIPVLVVIGKALKKSNRINDSLIPTILSIVGIPIALITSLANRMDPMNKIQIIVWILMSIGQGVFLGATAVGVHQFFKQHTEYKNLKTWEEKENLIKEIKESMEVENEHK